MRNRRMWISQFFSHDTVQYLPNQTVYIRYALIHLLISLKNNVTAVVSHIYALVNYPSLVQIMACRLIGAKPFSEPMLEYC